MKENKSDIKVNSVGEYLTANLQQIGFSTPLKAVYTTLKELTDNAIDNCNLNNILPHVKIEIEKSGEGSAKNSDKVKIIVEDNGTGINYEDLDKVFGTFLASSKFSLTKSRCSRGQAGIGCTGSVAYAQLTQARGAFIITKTKKDEKAHQCLVEIDIKNNKGIIKDYKRIDWDKDHGTKVELVLDGKIQINGDTGLISYLTGTSLINPDLTLEYKLPEMDSVKIERVSTICRIIPPATNPHPHILKLGEFISQSKVFSHLKVKQWLKEGFSRFGDSELKQLEKAGFKSVINKKTSDLNDFEYKELYKNIQNMKLSPPSTKSVVSLGEELLAKSIGRLGEVDFFAVVTRKPTICDFRPVQVEVAMARLKDSKIQSDDPVKLLRFSNAILLQFEKSACITTKAVESVNWKAYGLSQPKESIPLGPYVLAVSLVSPFMKFKNASKETIDGGDELLEEIRLALIQVGQRLAKHIRAESKQNELEEKKRYIEQFGPILIDAVFRMTKEKESRRKKVELGFKKILGRETDDVAKELKDSQLKLKKEIEKREGSNE